MMGEDFKYGCLGMRGPVWLGFFVGLVKEVGSGRWSFGKMSDALIIIGCLLYYHICCFETDNRSLLTLIFSEYRSIPGGGPSGPSI